jgi:hypothetical protein
MGDSLLPLEKVRGHLTVLGQHYAGIQEIPVDQIVGTVDRAVDFDAFFRPRRRDLRRRLDALATSFADRPMPPITVYEAGGLYFVADGHHRVALARRDHAEFIDAEVTQVRTSHRLHPGVDVLDLVHTEQHRRFKEQTGLSEAAPAAIVEFSRPVGYAELTQVIEAHAYSMSQSAGRLVPMADATRDWYRTSWLPALDAIESSGLKQAYDFKTDGDRYLWTFRKLQELRAVEAGASWRDAASNLAREPVQASHRRATLASRRKPLPASTQDERNGGGS